LLSKFNLYRYVKEAKGDKFDPLAYFTSGSDGYGGSKESAAALGMAGVDAMRANAAAPAAAAAAPAVAEAVAEAME
jgi:hypothetical protein